jgi:hypothetical protein
MVDWSRPLTRVLILKTGERLRTLHDAAELITRRFGSVTKSAPLEHAIGLLLRAVETGTRGDRKAATDQVALAALQHDATVQHVILRRFRHLLSFETCCRPIVLVRLYPRGVVIGTGRGKR